jgi:hypothetical protein
MSAVTTPEPLLFQPLTLRGLTIPNRIVISPMRQHAAERGHATAWHLVHLGKFVLGGAGLILTESTAVDPRGRIDTADLGLWNDAQIAPLRAVVDFVHTNGGAIGVQLAHAGPKAGSQALWNGGAALSETQLAADEEPWQRLGPRAPASMWWSRTSAMAIWSRAFCRRARTSAAMNGAAVWRTACGWHGSSPPACAPRGQRTSRCSAASRRSTAQQAAGTSMTRCGWRGR